MPPAGVWNFPVINCNISTYGTLHQNEREREGGREWMDGYARARTHTNLFLHMYRRSNKLKLITEIVDGRTDGREVRVYVCTSKQAAGLLSGNYWLCGSGGE